METPSEEYRYVVEHFSSKEVWEVDSYFVGLNEAITYFRKCALGAKTEGLTFRLVMLDRALRD